MIIYKLKQLLTEHGCLGVIRIILLPINMLWGNTTRLIITLYKSRHLAAGKWQSYPGFRARNSINNLYYWTEALNLDRYGRRGVSKFVSMGNYHLSNWWHLSLTSIFIYRSVGALLPIICMFGFLGFHLLWLQNSHIEAPWLLAVLLLAVISSYFYANAFVIQNYNVLGWLFMPLGLYGLLTENYFLAGFAWLGASVGSLTVVFLASYLTAIFSLMQMSFLPLFTLLPAFIKISTHFLYLESPLKSIKNIADGIGLTGNLAGSLKYRRDKIRPVNVLIALYFITIWTALAAFVALSGERLLGVLLLSAVGAFVINTFVARFADEQSIHMLIFSVATVGALNGNEWWLLLPYWIAVSPPAFIIRAARINEPIELPKSYEPFNIDGLIKKADVFMRKLPEESKVLLALKNPNGSYNRIFDGYRSIYELIFYVANTNNILAFPDWWAVFEHNNQPDAPTIWGTKPDQVIENCISWRAEYVLIYQCTGTKLESDWVNKGFTLISDFDWSDAGLSDWELNELFAGCEFTPKWFLLRKN